MRPIFRRVLAALLLTSAACGSSSPTGTNGNGTGPMTATLGGQAWVASTASASVTPQFGIVAMTGSGTISGVAWVVSISLTNVTTTGTYPFSSATARYAVVGNSANKGWGTTFSGGSGTITLTTFTAHQLTGTYSFTAAPDGSNPANTTSLTVDSGTFNISY